MHQFIIDNNDTHKSYWPEPTLNKLSQFEKASSESENSSWNIPSQLEKEITFTYSFKDADFKAGYVACTKKLKWYYEPIIFRIENPKILPQFNSIKNFFPKAFKGRKTFDVSAIITLRNGRIREVKAYSPQIERIDETLIDSIKRRHTLRIITNPSTSTVDKSLFTADQVFSNFDDNLSGDNIFQQTEAEILNVLLESQKVRNQKQLQYLAGNKHSNNQKIKFSLKPLFGFLFFIEGETMYHYCWELLNSHATYLWSFYKNKADISRQYQRIEESINKIRDMGREKYKSSYKQGSTDPDLTFSLISHQNINSSSIDGFIDWQQKLNEKVT